MGTFVSKIGTKIASWKEKAGEIVADKVKTVNRVEAPVDSNDKTRNGNKGGRYKLTLRLKNFKDLATDKKDKIRAGLKEKFGEVFGVKDAASDKKKVDIVEKGEEEEEKDETFTADATTTLKDWASKGRKKVTSTIVDVYTYFDKTISTKKDQFKAGAKNFLQNAKSNFDPAALAQKIKDKAGDLGDFAIEKVSDMKFEEVGEGATCSKPSKEWTWTPDAEDRTPKKWKKERRLLAGDFVKSKFGSTFSFEGTFKGKECGEQEVVTKVEQLRANICKKTNEFLGKTPTADEEKNQRPGLLNKVNRKKIDDAKCTAQEKSCTPRVVCDVSGDDDKKSDVRKGAQNGANSDVAGKIKAWMKSLGFSDVKGKTVEKEYDDAGKLKSIKTRLGKKYSTLKDDSDSVTVGEIETEVPADVECPTDVDQEQEDSKSADHFKKMKDLVKKAWSKFHKKVDNTRTVADSDIQADLTSCSKMADGSKKARFRAKVEHKGKSKDQLKAWVKKNLDNAETGFGDAIKDDDQVSNFEALRKNNANLIDVGFAQLAGAVGAEKEPVEEETQSVNDSKKFIPKTADLKEGVQKVKKKMLKFKRNGSCTALREAKSKIFKSWATKNTKDTSKLHFKEGECVEKKNSDGKLTAELPVTTTDFNGVAGDATKKQLKDLAGKDARGGKFLKKVKEGKSKDELSDDVMLKNLTVLLLKLMQT